jgi:hypothetical protein
MTARYGLYRIDYDPPPIPDRRFDWSYVHDQYDGPGDRRCGRAESLDDARNEIDALEQDMLEECCGVSSPGHCAAKSCLLRDHFLALAEAYEPAAGRRGAAA